MERKREKGKGEGKSGPYLRWFAKPSGHSTAAAGRKRRGGGKKKRELLLINNLLVRGGVPLGSVRWVIGTRGRGKRKRGREKEGGGKGGGVTRPFHLCLNRACKASRNPILLAPQQRGLHGYGKKQEGKRKEKKKRGGGEKKKKKKTEMPD